MNWFRVVNIYLLATFAAILVGLTGFLVGRLGRHESLVPIFGKVLGAGVVAFAAILGIGLLVGASHTVHWIVRTIRRKPPPAW